ncbi:Deoxycytidine triphosphate deaminase (modular protein) [uncultured Alphaproteobacteria bacterium]|uniref:dCTP deaminase n=1 Tax=uncultured Alphaproteobacteria bacterium TaxID=91750 RepID=A0A212KM43_9PROT|nr:Deoxycytidine triphosphate deaminase (modular protein) [uncultured Alphaproteobacteria bacterium]
MRGDGGDRERLAAEALRRNLRLRRAQVSARAAADHHALPSAALAAKTVGTAEGTKEGPNMGVMPDHWIRRMAQDQGMISPFEDRLHREGVISYGLSSYGYDARCSTEFKVFTNIDSAVVDPKAFSEKSFVDRNAEVCVIPPNSFALARTVEYFKIPDDVLVICLGKSTYARCGIIVNVTPLEPGWEGHVTLEFSNTTPLPAKIYANEGVAQFIFLKGDSPCEVTYRSRSGKYMSQTGVTLPRL